jgi:diguanylate cyclase (GGDEF)-like protein/PAS domain S-box-containing protein
MVAVDPSSGRIVQANNLELKMFGYNADEILTKTVAELTHPDDRQKTQDISEKLTKGLVGIQRYQKRYLRKDGSYFWAETTLSPLKDANGKVILFIGNAVDITERKQIEDALRASQHNLAEAQRVSHVGSWEMDIVHNRLTWSDEMFRIFGLQPQEFGEIYEAFLNNIHPDDRDMVDQAYTSSLKPGGRYDIEYRIIRKSDGQLRWGHAHCEHVRDADGKALRSIGTVQDITERKLANESLLVSEARLRAILDISPDMIWLKDIDGRYIAANKTYLKVIGRANMDELLGKNDFDLWPNELAKKYRADDALVMSTRKQLQIEETAIDNGEIIFVETFKAPITNMRGHLLGTVGFSQDVTLRKNEDGRIRHLANYDPLTDLPNRTLFSDRLQQALGAAKRDKANLALMFLDLDKFKPINDTFGHGVGDLLLKEAARRMQNCVRESDTVARLGGDEFAVLLPVIEAEKDAILVAEKIRHALNQPFFLVGQSLSISSSTGIAIYPENGKNDRQLLKNADIAMYYAKAGGRDNVKLFMPDMQSGQPA